MVALTTALQNDMLTSLKVQGRQKAMTIIASVKSKDGIVLATDSMSQIGSRNQEGKISIVKTYCNAKKLFRIRELPIGVMSYGLGNMGARSIENLILEFSRELGKYAKEPHTVKSVSLGLYQFVKEQYDSVFKEIPEEDRRKFLRLGFFICGYSPSKLLAEEYEFELPISAEIKQVRPPDLFGTSWRGIGAPFSRLFNGFDPRIAQAMKEVGITEDVIKKVLGENRWRMPIVYEHMPIQDAVDFAVFILETTIGTVTYESSPAPSCGGALQVAVVLPDKGWQWIKEPQITIE